jgi:hypothetical protein
VDPDRGAGDAGAQADPLGGRGDAPDDRPDEGAVALAIDPRVVVVRDREELEAGLLGEAGVADEVEWRVLLAGEGVPEVRHQ